MYLLAFVMMNDNPIIVESDSEGIASLSSNKGMECESHSSLSVSGNSKPKVILLSDHS